MIINIDSLQSGTHYLIERDDALRRIYDQYSYPPLWERPANFGSLVHIILEQQVSLASAHAAFTRLEKGLNGQVLPQPFLQLDDNTLRKMGFSRQKTGYARGLAHAVLEGSFPLDQLHERSDEDVRKALTALKGIGDWTADVYLSQCLLRPDILPKGDIALLEAFRVLNGLEKRPAHDVFVAATEHWRPWRSVGIRLLWHFYLSERGNP